MCFWFSLGQGQDCHLHVQCQHLKVSFPKLEGNPSLCCQVRPWCSSSFSWLGQRRGRSLASYKPCPAACSCFSTVQVRCRRSEPLCTSPDILPRVFCVSFFAESPETDEEETKKNPFAVPPDFDIFSIRDKERQKAREVRICALGQCMYKQFTGAGNHAIEHQHLEHERNNSCQI